MLQPVRYNDLLFRLTGALVAGHFTLTYGSGESFFQMLVHWYYWRDLLLSSGIAFLLISIVYISIVRLDRLYDWRDYPIQRAGLQLLLAVALPSIVAFLMAWGYFFIFGIDIFKTHYPELIFQLVVVLILLLNVYYLALYFFRRWQQAEHAMKVVPQPKADESKNKSILVQKGSKVLPVSVENICYIIHDREYNILRTVDREDFIINGSLDEIQGQLDEQNFFRVNRQMIANYRACDHFEPENFGKLRLIVNPPIADKIIISQKRAKKFREWIINKKPA